MTSKKRMPKLDESYFKKYPKKLFIIHKELSNQSIKDVKDIKLSKKLDWTRPEDLINFIEGQGGMKQFLKRPLVTSNVYIAMAIFNTRIHQEVPSEIFSSTVINESHSLHPLIELLDEDLSGEAPFEAFHMAYKRICSNKSYARAKKAVEIYVKQITDEQVDMVKDYLRDYIFEHVNSEAKDESILEEEPEQSKPSTSAKRPKPKQQPTLLVTKRRSSERQPLMNRLKRKSLVDNKQFAYNASILTINLEKREEAVAAREKSISLREAAVAAREKALSNLQYSDTSFVAISQ